MQYSNNGYVYELYAHRHSALGLVHPRADTTKDAKQLDNQRPQGAVLRPVRIPRSLDTTRSSTAESAIGQMPRTRPSRCQALLVWTPRMDQGTPHRTRAPENTAQDTPCKHTLHPSQGQTKKNPTRTSHASHTPHTTAHSTMQPSTHSNKIEKCDRGVSAGGGGHTVYATLPPPHTLTRPHRTQNVHCTASIHPLHRRARSRRRCRRRGGMQGACRWTTRACPRGSAAASP